MELKSYQKKSLPILHATWSWWWSCKARQRRIRPSGTKKNVLVGFGGMPNYVNVLPGVPHVCAKGAHRRWQDLYCRQFSADDF